jgi:hypothetical protein
MALWSVSFQGMSYIKGQESKLETDIYIICAFILPFVCIYQKNRVIFKTSNVEKLYLVTLYFYYICYLKNRDLFLKEA